MSDHIPYEHQAGMPHHPDEQEGLTAPGHDEHVSHGGLMKYVYVFLALLVLTGCSFFTYSDAWPFHSEPMVGKLFMMAVSCTKAMLVILFFMHVKYEANWKYVLTIPAGLMSIFLILMLVPDVGNRGRWYSQEREEDAAIPGATVKDPFGVDTAKPAH